MLTNNQVFYYHHNAKTCLLQLVLFDYNHFSNHLKSHLCNFLVVSPIIVEYDKL